MENNNNIENIENIENTSVFMIDPNFNNIYIENNTVFCVDANLMAQINCNPESPITLCLEKNETEADRVLRNKLLESKTNN